MLPLLILVGVVALIFYGLYVRLIGRRNRAREALSSVDVQLRKRHDLIPNVLTLAQKFMSHEKDVLEKVVSLRNAVQTSYSASNPDEVRDHLAKEGELGTALGRLFAVAESYPELRSSDTVREAQEAYEDVENHIAAARRFYNSAVTDLNNAVEIWPSSMIAGMIGVVGMPYFEVDEAVRQPISASDYLK